MSDESVETTLGEVVTMLRNGLTYKNDPQSGGLPISRIQTISDGSIDFEKVGYAGLDEIEAGKHLLDPGDILFSHINSLPHVGKTAIYRRDMPALVHGMNLIRIKADSSVCLPEFLSLCLQSGEMRRAVMARTQPAVNQVSINSRAIRELPLALPSLPVQRRIVDLMAHLDTHRTNLEAERESAKRLLDAWLDGWLHGRRQSGELLGEVCTFRSGPSWKAADERREPGAGALRVLKITNTKPDGRIDLSDEVYVQGLPPSTRTISDTSIVMVRTNGNRDRIGNVYLPTRETDGFAVSAFQFLGEAKSQVVRDFVFWILAAPSNQALMSAEASGSTGLGNLAGGWLKQFPMPESSFEEREEFVSTARSLAALLTALQQECTVTQELQSRVLGRLLSGESKVPTSYDELLGVG